ncbi:hypothetical protein VPH35_121716 [Triticum aestivum]
MVPQTATPPHLPTPAQHTHPCARPPRQRRPGSSVPTAAAEAPEAVVGAGGARWEPMGAREYYDYRRINLQRHHAQGHPRRRRRHPPRPTEPMAQVYRTVGENYGVNYSEDEMLMRTSRPRRTPRNKMRAGALP